MTLAAGAGRIDITPPMGVEMCGYGPFEKRQCTEVLDPLYVRALWLDIDDQPLVIVTADLCSVDLSMRNGLAAIVEREYGVEPDRLLLVATHTHSGPATQYLIAWGEPDDAYVKSLPEQMAAAVRLARESAAPARLGATRQRVIGIGHNREQPAFGPLDPSTQLARIDRLDGSPLAALFNVGAHAVTRYPYTSRISADWPALAQAHLSAELGGAEIFFLQGCCGNINGHLMTFGRTDVVNDQLVADMRAGDLAQRLCTQILPALEAIETADAARLDAVLHVAKLPCVLPDRDELLGIIAANEAVAAQQDYDAFPPLNQRLTSETEADRQWRSARFAVDAARRQLDLLDQGDTTADALIHLIRLDEMLIVGWPGEIYVELGLELRQRSPVPLTFVASFANDNVGYIPTPAAYESQGRPHAFGVYPTTSTPRIYGNLPFGPDVGTVLVQETLAAIEQHGMAADG